VRRRRVNHCSRTRRQGGAGVVRAAGRRQGGHWGGGARGRGGVQVEAAGGGRMGEASTAGQRGGRGADATAAPTSLPPLGPRHIVSLSPLPHLANDAASGRGARPATAAARPDDDAAALDDARAVAAMNRDIKRGSMNACCRVVFFGGAGEERGVEQKKTRGLIFVTLKVVAFLPRPYKPCAASPFSWPCWPWLSPRRVSVCAFSVDGCAGGRGAAGDNHRRAHLKTAGPPPPHRRPDPALPPTSRPSSIVCKALGVGSREGGDGDAVGVGGPFL
jgi:hypothetical protein